MARAALKCSRRTRTRRRILGDVGGRERGSERGEEDEMIRAFASNGKEKMRRRRRSSRAFSLLFVLLHFCCVFVQCILVFVVSCVK